MASYTGLAIGSIGLFVAIWSGWFVVRGPFFGYPIPDVRYLLIACAIFIVGTYLFAWGVDLNWQLRESERPNISEHQDHTLDTGFGPR